jgi:hypothetical protein
VAHGRGEMLWETLDLHLGAEDCKFESCLL